MRRTDEAHSPLPAAWWRTQSVARSESSTSATSSRRSVVHVITGTLGSHAPSRSMTASMPPCLVGDQDLRHEPASAHRCSFGVSRREVDAWRGEALLGEAHRPLAPQARAGIDQAARDQRRAVGVVADRADQPVVLVAEVDGERGDVAEASASPVAGPALGASTESAINRPTSAGDRARRSCCERRPVRRGARHAVRRRPRTRCPDAHVRVEHRRRRPPHPAQAPPARVTASRIAATSRVVRIDCGSTRPTRPPSGAARRIASARNSAAASAYGPPPNRDRPPRDVAGASWLRNGGLPITTSKRRAPQSIAARRLHDLGIGSVRPRTSPGRCRRRSTASPGRARTPARKRPSPHAGSSTVDGSHPPARTRATT